MTSRSIGFVLPLAACLVACSASDATSPRTSTGGAAGAGGSIASDGSNVGGATAGGSGGGNVGGAGANAGGTSTNGGGGGSSGTGGSTPGSGGSPPGSGGSPPGSGGSPPGPGGSTGGTGGGGAGGYVVPPDAAVGTPAPLPDLGPNVFVFDSSNAGTLQSKADTIYSLQEKDGGGTNRYAFLLKPGTYSATVKLGFYEELLGLGETPDATTITGLHVDAKWFQNGNATWNFWRAGENFATSGDSMWAVSQGTSLRHVHIKGNLSLADSSWSSGGFMADSAVDNTVSSGSQQQWFSRNDSWSSTAPTAAGSSI